MDTYGRYSPQRGRTDAGSAYSDKDQGDHAPGPAVHKKLFPVARATRGKKRSGRKRQTYRPEVIRLLGGTRDE